MSDDGTTAAHSGARAPRRYGWDALVVGAILTFWIVQVGPMVVTERLRGYDICRDAAAAINIQYGQVWADPAYADHSFWYPPLSPAMVAGVSSLTGLSPTDCYRWSQLVFNWLLPVGVYVLTRLAWGRVVGAFAVIAFLFAMPWWQTEVAHGQPSIHSVVWGFVGVLLYVWQERAGSVTWASAAGFWLGLSVWQHPFVPALLLVAIAGQAIWQAAIISPAEVDRGRVRRGIIGRHVVIMGIAALVAGPVLFQMLHGPVLNPAPREYIAPEMMTIWFALLGGNLWLWAVGLVGVVACMREGGLAGRLLVCCMVVAVLGQAPGYVRQWGGTWGAYLPVVVPHEFQRLFQLTWAVAIGIGIGALLQLAARLAKAGPWHWPAIGALAVVAAVGTGGRGFWNARENLGRYLFTLEQPPPLAAAGAWVRGNTDINDVFVCAPNFAFTWLNAETGRKVWLVPAGHSNPRVNWDDRAARLKLIHDAPTPEALWRLMLDSRIDYLIPTMEWQPRAMFDPAISVEDRLTYFRPVGPGGGGPVIIKRIGSPVRPVKGMVGP